MKMIFTATALVSLLFLILTSVVDAEVIQMNRQEIIQRSNLIFVGRVLQKKSRWNKQGNLIVTDYTFAVDDVLYGETDSELTLTFAGGQLPEEGQKVFGVPEFNVGNTGLLMIEESAHPLLSPITGRYQGKYMAVDMVGYEAKMALDGTNSVVKNESGQPLSFQEFVKRVKQEIPKAKIQPLPDRSVPDQLQNSVIKNLPYQIYDQSHSKGEPLSDRENYRRPAARDNTATLLRPEAVPAEKPKEDFSTKIKKESK